MINIYFLKYILFKASFFSVSGKKDVNPDFSCQIWYWVNIYFLSLPPLLKIPKEMSEISAEPPPPFGKMNKKVPTISLELFPVYVLSILYTLKKV